MFLISPTGKPVGQSSCIEELEALLLLEVVRGGMGVEGGGLATSAWEYVETGLCGLSRSSFSKAKEFCIGSEGIDVIWYRGRTGADVWGFAGTGNVG